MNKKIFTAVIAIALLAISCKSNTQVNSNIDTAQNTNSESTAQNGSIKSLIDAGVSKTCTFSSNENNVNSSGTVYVSGGKMRGDFTGTTNNVTTLTHMINDGTTSYIWADGQTTGMKMKFDATAATQNANTAQSVDPNKNYDFKCAAWVADGSKFEAPSSVTFTELPSAPTMKADTNASASMDNKALQQSICAKLSEPAKSQCLSSIK